MAAPTVVSGSTTLLAWSTGLTASGNVRANPTAGNLLATGTVASGTSITTAAVLASTDNGINTYVIAKSAVNSSSSTIAIGLCYAKNCVTHSPLTVTWKTQSPAAGGGTGFYLEVAGADTVAPLDSSTNSGAAKNTSVSSGAATNTAASALFVGHFGNDAGGASTVRQALVAGVVDELTLDIAPVLLGSGERIFDGVESFGFEPVEVLHSPLATHIRYRRAG